MVSPKLWMRLTTRPPQLVRYQVNDLLRVARLNQLLRRHISDGYVVVRPARRRNQRDARRLPLYRAEDDGLLQYVVAAEGARGHHC